MFKPFCDCTIILFYEATQTSFNKIWMPLCIFSLLAKNTEAKPPNMTGRSNGKRINKVKTTLLGKHHRPPQQEQRCSQLSCFVIAGLLSRQEAEAAHSYQLSHSSHLGRGAGEPVPTSGHKSKHQEKLLHLKLPWIFGSYRDFGLHMWPSSKL